MKKKLRPLQTNMLQCGVLMLIVGLLMTFALNKKPFGIGCLIVAIIFLASFAVLLIKDGLMLVDPETGEEVTSEKKSEKSTGKTDKE